MNNQKTRLEKAEAALRPADEDGYFIVNLRAFITDDGVTGEIEEKQVKISTRWLKSGNFPTYK